MPASLERTEYYWDQDRLGTIVNRRSSKFRKWPNAVCSSRLVAAIEECGSYRKLIVGSAATPTRVSKAILRHTRRDAFADSPDIGGGIPKELVRRVAAKCEEIVQKICRQFNALSTEERQTGVLTADVNESLIMQQDGWEATVFVEGFSPQTKEPRVGADIGVIFDVSNGGQRVSKALWVQAKRPDSIPDDPLTLPDLSEQMAKMLNRTKDAYGLLYGPEAVHVFQGWESQDLFTLSERFTDAIKCRRGDRRPDFVADTLDSGFLIESAFWGPETWAPRVNDDWRIYGF